MTTCDTSTVTAPGSAVWYDLAATTADVLEILRLTETDVDADRIAALVPAAAVLIDQYLDRPQAILGPPPSPPIAQALSQLTIELYRRKDLPFDTIRQILDPIRSEIIHAKQRFGYRMNRITSARVELFEALAPVLPGRVAATPPVGKPYVSPYVWIDQPRWQLQFIGTNTKLTVITFPVWIGYDGAIKAQVLGLDDLSAKVWDACLTVPAARPSAANQSVLDVGGTAIRGLVMNVDVTVGAMTLCLPTVEPSPIPPEPEPVLEGV